jgi:tetratricopeptide (TPR) repeat protein
MKKKRPKPKSDTNTDAKPVQQKSPVMKIDLTKEKIPAGITSGVIRTELRTSINEVRDPSAQSKKRDSSYSYPLREALMIQISRIFDERGWTQKQAAEFLGVTQPRISDLARARVENFTIDLLVDWLGVLGKQVAIEFKESENSMSFFDQIQFSATEDSISYYTKAITIDPLTDKSYLKRGDAYFSDGKYDLAVGDYTRALEFAAEPSYLRLRRAIAYNNLGQYLAALHDCEIVLNKLVLPDDVQNFSTVSGRDLVQEKYKNGRVETVITLDAELMSWALLTKARALNHLERHGEAIQCLMITTEMFPYFALAHSEAGSIYESMNSRDMAQRSYMRACEIDPTNVRFREQVAALEKQFERKHSPREFVELDALTDAIDASQTIPQRAYGYRIRGEYYRQVRQHALAVADFTKAVELDPENNSWVWTDIIYGRYMSGDLQGAIRASDKVISAAERTPNDLFPNDLPRAHMYKGWALEQLNRDDEALRSYDEGIKKCPADAGLVWARGILLEKFGRTQEALADYYKTIDLAVSSGRHDSLIFTEQVKLYIDRLEGK